MAPASKKPQLSVAVRCDATRHGGVGHLVRQLALTEELRLRGHHVELWGEVDVPWAASQLVQHDLPNRHTGDDPVAWAAARRADGIDIAMIDGYAFGPAWGAALRTAGVPVATMSDGVFGLDQDADLYVDQNLGADAAQAGHPGARFLVGLDYVLLRDVVLRRRGQMSVTPCEGEAPRVLVVFGGTDAYGGCRVLVQLLLATGLPVTVVAVAANPEIARELESLEIGERQAVEIHAPVDDLPGLAVTCQAAVSASGTSVWELLCLGVASALVCVTDNQLLGYHAATDPTIGVALPAGELTRLRTDDAARAASVEVLSSLISDEALRRRLSDAGRVLVDGRGRERVADAMESLVGVPPPEHRG